MPRQKLPYSAGLALGLGIFAIAVTASQVKSLSTLPQFHLGGVDSQLLAQQQQPRTALIIANYDYEGDDDLVGPRQDAADMYEKLKSLGFDVPPPITNATKQQMEQAIRDFVQRVNAKGPGGANVFYYSGHGVQINGFNYLLPVGLANTSNEIDVEYNAVRLDYVANMMYSVVSDFNFLIIDACRNNPLLRRWNRPKGPGSEGLAFIDPPQGTMIAYATQPGEIARDGDDNSPFTASLLNYLGRPGINIYQMLHQVREDVVASTNQGQRPQIPAWEGSLSLDNYGFSFNPVIATDPISYLFGPPNTDPTLISAATGVNYLPLKNALVARDYRLANQTTERLMLRAAGRESEGWLREEDLRNFSCDDLKIIDQLWLDHSDDRFGFSVQQQIYQSLGGTLGQYDQAIYQRFGDQVGWRQNNAWLVKDDLNYGSIAGAAPVGHLPFGHLPPGAGRFFDVVLDLLPMGGSLFDVLDFPVASYIFFPVDSCRL